MDRKTITKFLSDKLESERLGKMGTVFSSEVVLDYGTSHPKRIDFIQYKPEGTTYVSDIEHGEFTCFEVKSCIEDVYSGNGLNFEGDKNYIVTTMECYKTLIKDLESKKQNSKERNFWMWFYRQHPEYSSVHDFGIIVAIPNFRSEYNEFINPTEITSSSKKVKFMK